MLQRAAVKAKELIVVDTRRTGLAARAGLKPGTDGALALALLHVVVTEGLIDQDFVTRYTVGYGELVTHIQAYTPEWAAQITGIAPARIRAVARIYATIKPASIHWGNGMDMALSAFHTARALLILRAITGNLDRPGGDVLWVSPAKFRSVSPLVNPEIMGGSWLTQQQRALAIDGRRYPFLSSVHPPTFWQSVLNADPYRVKALWIVGSNPLVTHTHTDTVRKALEILDFLIVSEFFLTPTAKYADILLPAATWLETKDIANLHKVWCVLSRPKITQVAQARDDREVLMIVAKRLGLEKAFPWDNLDAYLEWVLEDTGMTFEQFSQETIRSGEMRYFKYKSEGFRTASGKFEIYSEKVKSMGVEPLPIYRSAHIDLSPDFPYTMTSAKVREFFHSEGRQLPSLRQVVRNPLVEIHPNTASSLAVNEGDWVWIETKTGKRIKAKARLFSGLNPDVVCVQPGWWFPKDALEPDNWTRSNVNCAIESSVFDPETGSESLRNTPCKIYKV